MRVLLDEKDLQKLIVIGDRILIKPKTPQLKTKSGLYLPPGVNENEKAQIGYVLKVGPGYPIPSINDTDEPWKTVQKNQNMYLCSLRKEIRLFIFRVTPEIEFNKEKYIVVPQSVLLLLRDEDYSNEQIIIWKIQF